MNTKIHIISFDVPFPPSYGGVIDVYYNVKALHDAGIKIIMHCFEYGRDRSPKLDEICEKIYYYPRKKTWLKQFSLLPYIVKTRNHPQVLANILKDPAPILFEGLHSCFFLNHPALKGFNKLVRAHNIEHEYYYQLCINSRATVDKLYFLLESYKLKFFEKRLVHASQILAISSHEANYFSQKYGKTILLPAFHPFNQINSIPGRGEYILFHGNLSVAENLKAADYLITNIFSEITVPFIIAGKNPPGWLSSKIKNIPHAKLEANPDVEKMDRLIREAQICLLPTFQSTGLKLKLLASLFLGRHCIANPSMVKGSGLDELCQIADTPDEIISLINKYMNIEFTINDIIKRRSYLESLFSNKKNAQKIIDLL